MDLISKLQEIGLTGREAEIYITMLQKKEFKAPEIAKITTISRTKIYEVLQNLINKGVCSEKYENGQKIYSVIEPDIAINNILSVQQNELIRRENIGAVLEKQLTSICKRNKIKDNPLVYIEILSDREQIKRRWFEIDKNAKKEVLIFTKPPYAISPEESIEEEKKIHQENKNRKLIKQMDICEYNGISSEAEKEAFIKIVNGLISNGEDVRIIKELPMKLAIVDEKIAVIALNDPISLKPSITTMIITHPSFAKAHKYVFESIWNHAMTVEEFKIKEKIQ